LALELIINQLLFPLDVFKHICTFWDCDEVGEYLTVLVVELTQFWQPDLDLTLEIPSLKELVDVIVNQIILKHGDHMRLFVVNQIVDHFDVCIFVLHAGILRHKPGHHEVVQLIWLQLRFVEGTERARLCAPSRPCA